MNGRFLVASATGFLGLAGLVHASAKVAARRIEANPDPYPFEALMREPAGEEVFVRREDGTRIRAIARGSGPVVVLSHGYGLSLREWNVVWDLLLGTGYRVIAFDHRGHGRSTVGSDGLGSRHMADDYRAVLEHFDVRDAVLVGHSTGCFLSVVFMPEHPAEAARRLRGAVLFAGTAGNVLDGAPQNRLQVPLIRAGINPEDRGVGDLRDALGCRDPRREPFPRKREGVLPALLRAAAREPPADPRRARAGVLLRPAR